MRKRNYRANGRGRASRETGAHGHAEACQGRHGSRSSRIAGFAERKALWLDQRQQRMRSTTMDSAKADPVRGYATQQDRRQLSRGSVAAGSRQQDGQSMHVSSTCGADRMESLKDRKVGPGGVRIAQRDRLMQGIGARASRAQHEQAAVSHRTSGEKASECVARGEYRL